MTTHLHETLRGGQAWSRRLARHQRLRLTDVEGRACVSALFYNALDPIERYNMPDTLKAQFTAFLTTGRVLYSDMGRVLCSIVADDCGWHDTISGVGGADTARARFGDAGSYQALRNDFHRNGRDNLLVELGKHGLGKRDVVSNVNFFVRIAVGDDGALAWIPANSRAGTSVELRFEMDTLVVLSNTPHPLDPAKRYQPPRVELTISDGPPAAADDRCRLSGPENGRGFALTEAYATEMVGRR
jgi:urea carboxylase-associated protein 2